MPVLEIITIGTELLLGEIQDTNSTYIARTLRDYGIDIYRITTIGDNTKRIASTIREALNRADIVITTGGLGPTIDDPTRQAVADAVGQDLIFLEELWKQIKTRFKSYGRKPTENNRRQAYIPKDAIPIHNPVGTAPCFIVEGETSCIVSLPGVPREMELVLHQSILPFLRKKYNLKTQIIKATVLHAATMGESTIDEKIGDLEEYPNPTVGLLAHPGQVDIRVTAKAPSEVEAFALNEPVVQELRRRLGENVYGQDEETLESVICDLLNQHHLKLCLIESGTNLGLIKRVKLAQPDEMIFYVLDPSTNGIQALKEQMRRTIQNSQCDIALGVALIINKEVTVHFIYQDMQSGDQKTSNYGGPRDYAPLWAQNTGLDFLRRHLITTIDNQKLGDL